MDAEAEINKAYNEARQAGTLRDFFLNHAFFSTVDLAGVLKLSVGHVRRLRSRAGLGKAPPPGHMERMLRARKPALDDIAPFEDTREWWAKHAVKYGTWKLARHSGLANSTAWKRIKKYAVPATRIGKIDHPCCTKEWLEEHYVRRKLSTIKCGELAGVSYVTVVSWLTLHGIKLRRSIRHPCV